MFDNDEQSSPALPGEIAPGLRKAFVLAGNALFTLQGREKRYTYRVQKTQYALHTVECLTGSDNTSNTDYRSIGDIRLGAVFDRGYTGTPSVQAFAWFWTHLEDARVVVLNAGACAKCGRTLTTPESIRTGLGPKCGGRS